MTNGERFKDLFGLYATEVWAMPEKDFLEWLNTLTTAAEPIKHGRWIKSKKSDYNWECSNCGYGLTDYRTTYCYDCGARMDEVEE